MQLSDSDLSKLQNSPGGIYAISRSGDYRCYIGSSESVRQRLHKHSSRLGKGNHHSPKLQRAVSKHGADAFEVFLIEVVADKQDLIKREQYWIDLFAAADSHGYNIARVAAAPTRGKKLSPETIEKITSARRGRKHSPETIEKIAATSRGRKHSPESIERMRVAKLGKKQSPEAIANGAAARRGKKRSPEAIAKTAASNRGRKHSPETIAKITAAIRGRKLSPESIEKMAAPNRGKLSPESISKREATKLAKRLAGHPDPNLGKKLSPKSIAKREATKRANREYKHLQAIFAANNAAISA